MKSAFADMTSIALSKKSEITSTAAFAASNYLAHQRTTSDKHFFEVSCQRSQSTYRERGRRPMYISQKSIPILMSLFVRIAASLRDAEDYVSESRSY